MDRYKLEVPPRVELQTLLHLLSYDFSDKNAVYVYLNQLEVI